MIKAKLFTLDDEIQFTGKVNEANCVWHIHYVKNRAYCGYVCDENDSLITAGCVPENRCEKCCDLVVHLGKLNEK